MFGKTITLSDDYVSYQDIFEKVNEEVSTQSKTVLSTVKMPKQEYVNLGGALVPVAKSSTSVPFSYSLNTYSTRLLFFNLNWLQFSFEVENDSWSVAKVKFTATTTTGSQLEQTHLQIPVTDNKVIFPNTFPDQFKSLSDLKIEIYFDNDREATLDFQSIGGIDSRYGVFTLKPLVGNNSGSGMAPKHFGVKRLGIADYLKVEQSVHAYVPGEVSNIENVMASELRHKSSVSRDYSEITDTTSKSQETEQISDTTKATRTDMQTEVAKELEKQQNWEAHTRMSGKAWGWSVEVGGSYANSTAQHDSTRQAVAKSQELTERAMERVLTKVSEERIQKIIREHTETNVHEFDNRGNKTTTNPEEAVPQHITGVYRWVDKKMKNQIYNYGKRTMFEFMIPEPARLHRLALKSAKNVLTAPQDPRKPLDDKWKMTDTNVDETILKHWADEYGLTIDVNPYQEKEVYFNFDGNQSNSTQLPDNFIGTKAHVRVEYQVKKWHNGEVQADNFKGGLNWISYSGQEYDALDLSLRGSVNVNYVIDEIKTINFWITFYCQTAPEIITDWKKKSFDAIIAKYEEALKAFSDAQTAADEAAADEEAANKEKMSTYYRDMEAEVLKHNCIAYLLQNNDLKLGKGLTLGNTMQSFAVNFGDDLDAYTSLAKFMEQAMEWSIMDYTFYPYYWADSNNWQEMYLSSDLDPLFRNFLQAGMARVIVTVKPGFEDAVNFFMSTGRIWNGGEVPVIGDPMYMSIVEELRQPTGVAQGKYWITRVPTALTILQAKSVGLEMTDALPIFPENDNGENCENPLELETKSAFKPVDAVMQHGGDTSTLPSTIIKPI